MMSVQCQDASKLVLEKMEGGGGRGEGGKEESSQLLEEGRAISPLASGEPSLRLGVMAGLEALKGSESWKDTRQPSLVPALLEILF